MKNYEFERKKNVQQNKPVQYSRLSSVGQGLTCKVQLVYCNGRLTTHLNFHLMIITLCLRAVYGKALITENSKLCITGIYI